MGSSGSEDGIFPAGSRRGRKAGKKRALTEPSRSVPVFRECEVLVVGGGPAGTAAAVAAAREGAETILLERYNHLGGLSTGGLVIWIDRMTDWSGSLVIRGFAEELLDRLPPVAVAGPAASTFGSRDTALVEHWRRRSSAHHHTVTWAPTVNPEHLKLASLDLVREAGATLVLHAWGAAPVLNEDGSVGGVYFESKEGRQAIAARVVIDCTGDGDIFHRAGAGCDTEIDERSIHHCMNTSWLFGDVDMAAWLHFRYEEPDAFAAFMLEGRLACGGGFERPVVSWRDDIALFMGPRISGLSGVDVTDLTEAETISRRYMAAHLSFYRKRAPGFAKADLLQTAPQLGVRHSRRLVGIGKVRRDDWDDIMPRPDEIGVSPSLAPKWPSLSVPYGCLIPETIEGVIAAGRHVSCDPSSHSILREIPQCWLTGQAAGIAAAIAAQQRVKPREVDVAMLQAGLRRQHVHLSSVAALNGAYSQPAAVKEDASHAARK